MHTPRSQFRAEPAGCIAVFGLEISPTVGCKVIGRFWLGKSGPASQKCFVDKPKTSHWTADPVNPSKRGDSCVLMALCNPPPPSHPSNHPELVQRLARSFACWELFFMLCLPRALLADCDLSCFGRSCITRAPTPTCPTPFPAATWPRSTAHWHWRASEQSQTYTPGDPESGAVSGDWRGTSWEMWGPTRQGTN